MLMLMRRRVRASNYARKLIQQSRLFLLLGYSLNRKVLEIGNFLIEDDA